MRSLPLLIILVGSLAACGGGTPANVSGQYTVAVTDKDNGCNLMSWTVGQSTSNIDVAITQDGSSADATVQGLVGTYLDAVLGSHDFTGDVDGHHLSLTLSGTRSMTSGTCQWTYTADLEADLSADLLEGTIDYTPKTNGSSSCTAMQNSCTSTQDFNGTRPPS